jgi:cell division protein FtsN
MKTERGSFMVGLIVGLLLGLALALSVAIYFTRSPVPFVNKVPQRTPEQDAAEAAHNKSWDPNSGLSPKSVRAASAAASTATPDATPSPAAITPPTASAPTARGATPPAATADAASRPASGASSGETNVQIQAGAFSRSEDAEAQRARLSLLGYTPRVVEREQVGHTVYRVRLGPYSREDADAQLEKIRAAGIDAALVKGER